MAFKPTPKNPKLERLLAEAREHVMTPAELYEQRISWVYGQLAIGDPSITKDVVRRETRKLYGPPPEEEG